MTDPLHHIQHFVPDLNDGVEQLLQDSAIQNIRVTFVERDTDEHLIAVVGRGASYQEKKAFVLTVLTDFTLDGIANDLSSQRIGQLFKPIVTGF